MGCRDHLRRGENYKEHNNQRDENDENGHDAGEPQAYKMKMPEAFSY
jgi:hypothetical protein